VWLIIFPSEDRRRSPSPHHPAGRMPSGTRAEIPYSQLHPSPAIVRPVALAHFSIAARVQILPEASCASGAGKPAVLLS
jgi:hypothetical protein